MAEVTAGCAAQLLDRHMPHSAATKAQIGKDQEVLIHRFVSILAQRNQ